MAVAHITLSVPEDVYTMMKKHPEIKWSEVARTAILEYLKTLEERSSGAEILESLPSEIRTTLRNLTEREAREFYSRVGEKEWKRIKSLTRPS